MLLKHLWLGQKEAAKNCLASLSVEKQRKRYSLASTLS